MRQPGRGQWRTHDLASGDWSGFKATSDEKVLVSTDTEHFVIHTASGGVYAQVQIIEHLNVTPGGKVNVQSFNLGSCQPPSED